MTLFKIKEAFYLQTAKQLTTIGGYYSTDDEAQIEELRKFAKDGSCEEAVVHKAKPEEKPDETVDPSQDLAQVPGVGVTTLKKLNEAGITTVDQLKEKLDTEEVKDVLKQNHEKVSKHFTPEA